MGNFSSKLGLESLLWGLCPPGFTTYWKKLSQLRATTQVAVVVGGWAPLPPSGDSKYCSHRCLHGAQLGGEIMGQPSVYFSGLVPQITEHLLSTCMIPFCVCVCVYTDDLDWAERGGPQEREMTQN